VKNSLFDSLFLVNLSFSLKIFCVLENEPCMAIYIVKMGVWTGSQTMRDSFQTSTLMQKTCFFYVSKTLLACASSCLRTHALRLCTQAKCFLWPFFSKNRFFFSLKSYIFHFNIPQINF